MKKLLNNLYVTTDGSYVHKERETLIIEQEGEKVFQLPFHSIQNMFCFGNIMVSPALMAACGEKGIGISFFTGYGKFQSRVQGPQSGNVLLRRAQYREADDSPQVLARLFIAAKLVNCRNIVMKHQRNHGQDEKLEKLAKYLADNLKRLERSNDVDQMRGIEGDSAASYFACFNNLIVEDLRESFPFSGRTKRPPLDRVNALLSFAYTLLTYEIASALQGVGIDPYVGFLHTDRSGRVSLALDMLEEFRAWWCDRFVLTLINRKQISPEDFIEESSSAIRLTDDARKMVLTAWQEKKQEELQHPYTEEKIHIGLLPHVQAMLLSRYLRKDMEIYTPFIAR
ncbi:MAG TPA: type I-C CRISPR-associated endonuclease Cas1c [Cyclobacteriaceae bacterium]